MDSRDDDRLIGQIYDAAFDPGLWVPVMEQLADRLSGQAACMTTLDIFTGEGVGHSALVPDDTMDLYLSHWSQNNPLHEIGDPLDYMANWRPATIRYEDWIDRQSLHRSAFFNEFLRPIDSENGIMMGLALVGTSTVTMNIARPLHRDIFEDETIALARHWQEHLSRAVRLGQTVQISQVALDAVDQLVSTTPQCLFFLDGRGRIKRMTAAAEAMLAAGSELIAVGGCLAAKWPEDDSRLQPLVAHAGITATGGTLRLSQRSGRPREVQVAPLGPRSFANWSAEPIILVTVIENSAPTLPIEMRLRRHFNLTPAETRVALALMRGGTLREVAEQASVSIHTVRVQLGVIFLKTGCRRQADLVRMLLTFEQDSR